MRLSILMIDSSNLEAYIGKFDWLDLKIFVQMRLNCPNIPTSLVGSWFNRFL